MYLILEEDIEGCGGDIVDQRYHVIHIGWLTDVDALRGMSDQFFGFKFFCVREAGELYKSDTVWEFDRLHQKWYKLRKRP